MLTNAIQQFAINHSIPARHLNYTKYNKYFIILILDSPVPDYNHCILFLK